MEGFLVLVYVIILVWGVLNIILFFKIWGMTNDVNVIKEYLIKHKLTECEQKVSETQPIIYSANSQGLKVGDRVRHDVYNKDKIMIIGRLNADGTCLCVDENGNAYGTYTGKKLTKIELT